MDPDHLLALLKPMLASFMRELEELRAAGATQSDVERMLDDFERRYAVDEESKLVVEVLRQAARPSNEQARPATAGTCHECKQPLIAVDNRRQHLVGCLVCNRWTDKDGNTVQLSEKDLVALYGLNKIARPPQAG
jgi:hypothetical protein